jgi:long-chain acyl-CoA synthetase
MSETRSGPRTIAELADAAAEQFGEHVAARHKRDSERRHVTFAQAAARINELALGLIATGIAPGDRVAILSNTRLEWTLVSLAASAAGAVVVPVYPTNAASECEWVLGDSGTRLVVCEDASQAAKIEQVRPQLPALEYLFVIDAADGVPSLDELVAGGAGQDRSELTGRQAEVRVEDIYTIIYTSGTTGPPKGTVLTHANAMSVSDKVRQRGTSPRATPSICICRWRTRLRSRRCWPPMGWAPPSCTSAATPSRSCRS